MKQKLQEETSNEIIASWKEWADKVRTPADLSTFVSDLINLYEHDYGTIVHAMAAAMSATMKVIDRSPQGGITGFQAQCLFWELATRLMGLSGFGARVIDFDNLLYPQYGKNFKTIPKSVAEKLPARAQEKLSEHGGSPIRPEVLEHWQFIIAGGIPFGLEVADE